MSDHDHDHDLDRLEELFQRAADLPPAERAVFLDAECGDGPLRERLDAMLVELDADRTMASPEIAATVVADAPPVEGPGTVIDRYKLLQQIGEGGFGVVYMAEQLEPVRRKVALKVIKLGMDTKEVVARFDAERQALALMDHPNIARVLDGGATETGRPYFVMELVRGISITEYCDQNSLGPDERLRLFVDVCQAIQHAHQKGVIHRDLKPSNVLVTLHDGTPVPKVIDFGIAKAMHGRLTDKTLFTRFQQFVGTPAYMSPEQAELSALDVDTRSDIYSLGVLLYELLTGSVPFDTTALMKSGLAEIQRVLREVPPERPSLRISTGGRARAGHGGLDRREVARRVKGDLDWIVMKALEKERVRRYATASELGADVLRHLRNEPVVAGPPSALYRARKFVARNRGAVFGVATSFGALLLGTAVSLNFAIEASRQRDEASQQRDATLRAHEKTNAITSFLVRTLALSDPSFAQKPDVSVREMLDHAAERIGGSFAGMPDAEARVRSTIGMAYASLGENGLAELHLRRTAELQDELPGVDPNRRYLVLWRLTHVLFKLERNDAMSVAQKARRVAHDHIRSRYPDVAPVLDAFIDAVNRGAYSTDAAALRDADRMFARSVEVAERDIPAEDRIWPTVADSWIAAGYTLWYSPHEEISAKYWEQALAVQERCLKEDHAAIAATLVQLVGVLTRAGRADEAEEKLRRSVAISRANFGSDSFEVATGVSMLGENLVSQEKYAEAEPLLLEGYEALKGEVDSASVYAADAIRRLVVLYSAWGREEQARSYREEYTRFCAGVYYIGRYPIVRDTFGPDEAEILAALDELYARCGGLSYAAAHGTVAGLVLGPALDAVELASAPLSSDDPYAVLVARLLLGWANALTPGEMDEARGRMLRLSLGPLRAWDVRHPVELADALALLSEVERAAGDEATARRLAREAWTTLGTSAGLDNWIHASARVRIARALAEEGMLAEAGLLLRPAISLLSAEFGFAHPDAFEAKRCLERVEALASE